MKKSFAVPKQYAKTAKYHTVELFLVITGFP
jgi:hypothetical protein